MPQTTRGSIEEGSAQFHNQDYKDVTFDINQAGRTHIGTPSIKLTSLDNVVYSSPNVNNAWTLSADTDVADAVTSINSTDGTVVAAGTSVITFNSSKNADESHLASETKINVPKFRISFRLGEGQLVHNNTTYNVQGSDYFDLERYSDEAGAWQKLTETIYRSTDGGANYSATAVVGRINGAETSPTKLYHFYVDVNAGGQYEKMQKYRFKSDTSGGSGDNGTFILYNATLTAGGDGVGDLGLNNANIGIAFTNITTTGFRIVLSSKFTGYVRYLISAYE